MGAVSERLPSPDIDALLVEFKKFAKLSELDTADDFTLQLSLEGAMEQADLYLNNPFTKDGVDLTIPSAVKLGVFTFALQDALRTDPSIASKSSSRISESYRTPEEAVVSIRERYWSMYRRNPGL